MPSQAAAAADSVTKSAHGAAAADADEQPSQQSPQPAAVAAPKEEAAQAEALEQDPTADAALAADMDLDTVPDTQARVLRGRRLATVGCGSHTDGA